MSLPRHAQYRKLGIFSMPHCETPQRTAVLPKDYTRETAGSLPRSRIFIRFLLKPGIEAWSRGSDGFCFNSLDGLIGSQTGRGMRGYIDLAAVAFHERQCSLIHEMADQCPVNPSSCEMPFAPLFCGSSVAGVRVMTDGMR